MTQSKVFWWSILGLAFMLPISQPVNTVMLALILLGSFFMERKIGFINLVGQGWDTWLLIGILGLGLAYTENMTMGFRVVETSLSLLVLPLVFVKVKNFDRSHVNEILYAFLGGLLIACVYCLFVATRKVIDGAAYDAYLGYQLTDSLVNVHPIYFAYYLIFAVTVGLYLIYYDELKLPLGLTILLIIFFFVMLMLTMGRTAFIGMLLSLLYFMLKFIFESTKTRKRIATFLLSSMLLICLFIVNSSEQTGHDKKDSYWERYVLWESAIQASPDIFFGVGTGDYKDVLNQYYIDHNLFEYAASSYNAHNQFIEILLSVGVLGFVSLLLMLARPLYLSIRNQDALGFLTFFPFFIYGMTEVFLGRYQGIFFFVLLHQIFISYYRTMPMSFSLKNARGDPDSILMKNIA